MTKSTKSLLKKTRKLKIDIYMPIILRVLKEYQVEAEWSELGDIGDGYYYWWSDIEDRVVLIPRPTTAYKFMVCLHEIGHCVKGRRVLNHQQELIAEEWALRTARRFGITQVAHYKKHAAKLLLAYVKADISAGLVHHKKINKNVKRFITRTGIKYEV